MDTTLENINAIIEGRISWPGFLSLLLIMVLLYSLLRLGNQLLGRTANWGRALSVVKAVAHYAMLIYEPMAVIVLTGAFVMVNPVYHSVLIILLLLLAFSHLRNYISGRLMQLNPLIAPGRRMSCRSHKGIIIDIRRQGIALQTRDGIQFVSYSQLLTDGYAVEPGDEIGGYYKLKISWEKIQEVSDPASYFGDMLTSSPYLNRVFKPEIIADDNRSNCLQVKVLLQEESHLYELIALIKEWGFDVEEKMRG